MIPNVIRLAVILLFSLGLHAQQQSAAPESLQLSADKKFAMLGANTKIAIPLVRDVKAIAILRSAHGKPYGLISGADCVECDANNRVYVYPDPEPLTPGGGYFYPGELADYATGKVVQKVRMFYGRCISDESDSVIWFAHVLADDGKWHSQTTALRFDEDRAKLYVSDPQVTLAGVLARVRQGACVELPGVNGTTEP